MLCAISVPGAAAGLPSCRADVDSSDGAGSRRNRNNRRIDDAAIRNRERAIANIADDHRHVAAKNRSRTGHRRHADGTKIGANLDATD